ncbi:crossover junction endodeoxyribonuclease RuvC [Chitinimonas koreensis]|uniref:crossover junction endodeoxyribonuclease RuvC n=1 Tax=Chitinimonas koreensis TaxID=356302 RepID=UPI0004226A5E|nr:crossover junction endodeoxyribonuclease RuvC [Chitinimonas koreensis]QNM96563.1 crossover junction endodeoxyribonuclease RuvC [Chitinimonas koreensis]
MRSNDDQGAPSVGAAGLRILGIDPGLRTTGFGVIDVAGQARTYVASGCIRSGEGSLPERLRVLLDGIAQVCALHRPDVAAIEQVFVNVNPQSTLLLGQARGAAISALVLADLPVSEYTALQVKQAVVGNGHAAKEQVSHMVQRLLKLNGEPQSDAADALACALTHANHATGGLGRAGIQSRRGRWTRL